MTSFFNVEIQVWCCLEAGTFGYVPAGCTWAGERRSKAGVVVAMLVAVLLLSMLRSTWIYKGRCNRWAITGRWQQQRRRRRTRHNRWRRRRDDGPAAEMHAIRRPTNFLSENVEDGIQNNHQGSHMKANPNNPTARNVPFRFYTSAGPPSVRVKFMGGISYYWWSQRKCPIHVPSCTTFAVWHSCYQLLWGLLRL